MGEPRHHPEMTKMRKKVKKMRNFRKMRNIEEVCLHVNLNRV